MGVSSSRIIDELALDADELIGSTSLTMQAPLSALATAGAIVDVSVPVTIRTTTAKSGANFDASHTDTT